MVMNYRIGHTSISILFEKSTEETICARSLMKISPEAEGNACGTNVNHCLRLSLFKLDPICSNCNGLGEP